MKWNLCVCACVLRCVYACHCAYTSEAWGWFKVPLRCVRTAFTNTLIMQKMLSSSASLFVYGMSPVTIKHVEVSPSLCHFCSLPSPPIEQIVPSSFCSCSPSLLSLLKRFNLKGFTETNTQKQWCTVCWVISFMYWQKRPAKTEITWATIPDQHDRHWQGKSTSHVFGLQDETKVNKTHTGITTLNQDFFKNRQPVLTYRVSFLYLQYVAYTVSYTVHRYLHIQKTCSTFRIFFISASIRPKCVSGLGFQIFTQVLKQNKRYFPFIYCGKWVNLKYLCVAELCDTAQCYSYVVYWLNCITVWMISK